MKLWYSLPLLTSMALIGCGNSSSTGNTNANTSPADTTSNEASSSTTAEAASPAPAGTPTYKMATIDYTPFAFRDEYGKPIGYDIDLIHAIGQEAGFQVEISQLPFSDLLQSVQDGKSDFAMSGLSMLPSRQEVMLSSTAYSKGKPGYLVSADSASEKSEDLLDKKVSVLANSSLHGILDKAGVKNLVLEPTMFLSFKALFTKESDAAFGMQPTLFYSSDQFSENPVKFIAQGEPVLTTVYAGKDKQEVIDKFNEGLEKIQTNGKYQQINQKWFGDNASEIAMN